MGTESQTPDEIRAEIAQRQNRLADTVDELTSRAHPKTLVNQGKEEAAARVRDAVFDEQGDPRLERLAAAGGAIATLLILMLILRSRRKKKG